MKRVDDVWDACPEGELVQLAAALRNTYRLRILSRVATLLAILVTCGTVAAILAPTMLGG